MENKISEPEANVAGSHVAGASPGLETPHADAPRKSSLIDTLFPKDFHAQPPAYPVGESPQLSDEKEKDRMPGSPDGIPDSERRESVVVHSAKDLVTTVIGLEDDPTLNPWTFRAFFLGKYQPLSKSNN
jgi:hypothetical protein